MSRRAGLSRRETRRRPTPGIWCYDLAREIFASNPPAMTRRYVMGARADAAARTRRRIVDAAMEVQASEGAAASWEAIARRADVSTATVYRHFRSLDELVPACVE